MAMVFVFWELVGICSYFLIGFYIERHSASTAANKAFIVNRVGDFGMLIGLMAIWSSARHVRASATSTDRPTARRASRASSASSHDERAATSSARADGMIACEARDQIAEVVGKAAAIAEVETARRVACVRTKATLGPLAAVRRRRRHLLRLRRQKRPVPAAHVVARRDGRPDARLRARALGDDGRRRRVSGRPVLSDLLARSAAGDRHHRLHHAVPRGDDRHHRHRHQARARLFHRQPARLHDARPRASAAGWPACST